jgi:uncharacterized protein
VTEALDALGLRVVKLHCSVGRFTADDERFDPLWRRVSETGHPVVVHVGHAVDGQTAAPELDPLARVTRRWPDARIVIAHCASPSTAAALALLESAPAVCADLTPVVPRLAPVSRDDLAGLEDRILFGSDARTRASRSRTRSRTCARSASTRRPSAACSAATPSDCSRAERLSV